METLLRGRFPQDLIESVAKGGFGGDILHRVRSPSGLMSGAILWESKRTKGWSDGWLAKLQTKMELAYQYLTGPHFRHRMDAIVEKFTDMRDDLDRERKLMTKLWAKREEQLKGVLDNSAGLYGDLQGIAGRAMEEIDGLDILFD